ncbi:LysR family transcriptional regulator [Spongiactinospora gelatinilytica]|uniref:LysR family transcriptional regulator n=1 Tax=Spongiactinospora gelatinilytica TaxID=2666298 RepID=A0A2W2I3T4_9ACTN|nr:LysR substrate-binding domain-containing protein [Spongiactinospora gelatinilytica]PZG52797.1 LysR family transcriptional regulator [Spongiactinospora gelatinilytica]
MLKPLHLLTLRAVCRTGSFATAGRELGYTASAVSQQMAALEKDSGLALFEREARGVRATAAAYRLAELSERVLADLADLGRQTRELAGGATGRLRLGSFATASVRLIPATLSAFAGRYPRVEILLEEGEPDELLPLVQDGTLDLALVYEYGLTPRQWPDGLTAHHLLREDLLLLRPGHAHPEPPELSALAGERWIASREGTGGALSLTRLCAAAGFAPAVAFRSDNYDVVRQLVAATLGVAIVPALGHVADERVQATRLDSPAAHRDVLALHRAANTNPLLPAALATLHRSVLR